MSDQITALSRRITQRSYSYWTVDVRTPHQVGRRLGTLPSRPKTTLLDFV